MKCLLVLITFSFCTSIHSQSLNEQAAVIKAEKDNFMRDAEKDHTDARITSVEVEILSYKIISLRDWWKELAGLHRQFETVMDSLLVATNDNRGSSKTITDSNNTVAKSGQHMMIKRPNKEAEYFEKRYADTPETIKAYEVSYKVSLSSTNRYMGNHREYLRMIIDMKNFTEIHSF